MNSNRHTYEPYLSRRNWTESELNQVGFFEDGLSEQELETVLNDRRWVTPTSHLLSSGVVLCATGAFSPFHAGHLKMLEIAKKEIEDAGGSVAGAFVQPDHDGYVSFKRGGVAACDAATRIHIAQQATKHVPWIAVDPWPSIYQDRALNYTTILSRTDKYLSDFGKYNLVYVFGSDNEGFKLAFSPSEYVCVGRPGYGLPHPASIDISSTSVRKSLEQYPPFVGDFPSKALSYVVRDDLSWATSHWSNTSHAVERFKANLSNAFEEVWGQSPTWYELKCDVAEPHISFDRNTGAKHWVSRVFNPCTHQNRPVSWLSSDLSEIPAGEYALVDDDIASGTTVSYIKQHTPQVTWTKTIGLLELAARAPVFDVVDARDFLFGSKLGGLCVNDRKQVLRAPYITPWVNLTQRAKIIPSRQAAFVRRVILANIEFFKEIDVRVKDTDNPRFWQRLGYDSTTPMLDISSQLLNWNKTHE